EMPPQFLAVEGDRVWLAFVVGEPPDERDDRVEVVLACGPEGHRPSRSRVRRWPPLHPLGRSGLSLCVLSFPPPAAPRASQRLLRARTPRGRWPRWYCPRR